MIIERVDIDGILYWTFVGLETSLGGYFLWPRAAVFVFAGLAIGGFESLPVLGCFKNILLESIWLRFYKSRELPFLGVRRTGFELSSHSCRSDDHHTSRCARCKHSNFFMETHKCTDKNEETSFGISYRCFDTIPLRCKKPGMLGLKQDLGLFSA